MPPGARRGRAGSLRTTVAPAAIGREETIVVYSDVNGDHRRAIATLAETDPVSEDLLTGHLRDLEQFQWFVRAHHDASSGELPTADGASEKGGAAAAHDGG